MEDVTIGDKMVEIIIDHSKCDGEDCHDCVDLCPNFVLEMVDGKVIVKDIDDCSYCETCVDLCPNEAITLKD